jgi:hypothetical protein
MLKLLTPVSEQARIDFNRGLLFGRLAKHGFQFKYPHWSLYPLDELAQLETLTLAFFAYMDSLNEKPKINMPMEVAAELKQKNLARSKGMYSHPGITQWLPA